MIRIRWVDRYTGLTIHQQRRLTDAQAKALKDKADAYADRIAQAYVEGRI